MRPQSALPCEITPLPMDSNLINLLPPERQRALAKEYFIRLGVVAALLLTVLTVAAGILLLPTYVFLSQNTAAKRAQLTSVESVLSSADEEAMSGRLAALANEASRLVVLEREPPASAIIRAVLDIPRPGVVLSEFRYVRAEGKAPEMLAVSGTASTREALRSYQLALQGAPFTSAANLPVSAYAKDSNISFTITLTLAP